MGGVKHIGLNAQHSKRNAPEVLHGIRLLGRRHNKEKHKYDPNSHYPQ